MHKKRRRRREREGAQSKSATLSSLLYTQRSSVRLRRQKVGHDSEEYSSGVGGGGVVLEVRKRRGEKRGCEFKTAVGRSRLERRRRRHTVQCEGGGAEQTMYIGGGGGLSVRPYVEFGLRKCAKMFTREFFQQRRNV